MNSNQIKQLASELGADLCGIASIDRFYDAPIGFSPVDLMPSTQSVISFAMQVPKTTLHLDSKIPYTVIEDELLTEANRISYKLMLKLESEKYEATIVPSEPYEYWNEKNKTGKGLLSLKHLAYKSGLGVFGKNQLLYNSKFGNLMKLGAILTNAKLEPDYMLNDETCKPNCKLCIEKCPAGAINDNGIDQLKCREKSIRKTAKGDVIYDCTVCRSVCVNVSGTFD